MKKMNQRLVPLDVLYPDRPPKEAPKGKSKPPFYKPGKSFKIPEKTQEAASVRYLQALLIKKSLQSLEQPLRDIEEDASFIANSMDAALQVPKSIETTFTRIHGRIYDIQREIEDSSTVQDDKALIIQRNFRMAVNQKHLNVIEKAINNTIKRDCGAIHECLLGFLLSYAKSDDHFKMLHNRRFLVRNRQALKYWKDWSVQAKERSKQQKEQVIELQKQWTSRVCLNLIVKWKELSFSKHSRKALKILHDKIMTEAKRRLNEKQGTNRKTTLSADTLNELLEIERENVIIEYAQENSNYHLKKISFHFWKIFLQQCKSANRSGNVIARRHYVFYMKKSFFKAWFSLSVGRVVVFGGYSSWRRPINKNLKRYKEEFDMKKTIVTEWRWLCIRQQRMIEFRKKVEREFLRKCLLEFHYSAAARHNRLSTMMENYLNLLHQRLHRVFNAWHFYAAKEIVRKRPMLFLLNRSILMRKYKVMRRFFRKWRVKFKTRQTQRFTSDAKSIKAYTSHWEAAGNEMTESIQLITQLNAKLTNELSKRKEDLSRSLATSDFMKNEQKSLAYAMQNCKMEIEKLHKEIGKTTMRYFVDIKPVHGHVVENVPLALKQYLEEKEAEKSRLLAQKQAAAEAALAASQKKSKATNTSTTSSPSRTRRKTTFAHKTPKSSSKPGAKSRKSTLSTIETIPEKNEE